jgi:hypothetical protein
MATMPSSPYEPLRGRSRPAVAQRQRARPVISYDVVLSDVVLDVPRRYEAAQLSSALG